MTGAAPPVLAQAEKQLAEAVQSALLVAARPGGRQGRTLVPGQLRPDPAVPLWVEEQEQEARVATVAHLRVVVTLEAMLPPHCV